MTPIIDIASLKTRLHELNRTRAELETICKEAFMASPPMPAPGGMPPQGMPPQGGPPVDPATGMPIDPNTGMPMDPNAMQGGMPPQGGPPQGGGSPLSPEMVEQILGLLEELAASKEQHEKALQQLGQQLEECMGKQDELDRQFAQLAAQVSAVPAQ